MLIHLESMEQFNETIKSGVTLVDFYATWCGPCKMLAPELEKFAELRPDVTVIKVDVDEFGMLASEYNVRAVPTLVLFKDGYSLTSATGFRPEKQLEKFVDTAF